MVRTLTAAAALALLVAPQAAQAQAARPDSMALARQFTLWFYTGETDSLWAHTTPAVRERMGASVKYLEGFEMLTARAGMETEVLEERFRTRNGQPQYWRTARFSEFDAEPILFRWVIVDGMIGGFGMSPLSQAPPVDPGSP